MKIRIEHLSKTFAGKVILKDFSCTIPPASITFFSGPSGCGKTTLLRIIAGLETPDPTTPRCGIYFDEQDITMVPPQERGVGFVFQNYALWPHMNVFDHCLFPIVIKRTPTEADKQAIQEMLGQLGLQGFEQRFPHELSGGQQQRVALARALVGAPRVLLLDEPFSNLDPKLRAEARKLLEELHQRLSIPILIVSHDPDDAAALATQQILMTTL
jgi:ABC-type Fe3+/spermidine/putrescine transport system ATPase subunit